VIDALIVVESEHRTTSFIHSDYFFPVLVARFTRFATFWRRFDAAVRFDGIFILP
jgi:hypothetical protein